MSVKRLGVILLACVFVGCDKQPEQNSTVVNQRIQTLEAEINGLKSSQAASDKFNSSQWQCDTNFEQRLQSLEMSDRLREQKWILLDPTSKSYQRIDTSIGSLLVSVKGVTPYLDGYKVTLAVGNPYDMDFKGFLVSCKWGASFTYTNGIVSNYEAVQNSQKSKDSQQTDVLYRGYWNAIELTIAPATADEIKNLRISIQPDTVSLLTKPETQP